MRTSDLRRAGWVIATPAAIDAIERRRARNRLVALHHCGGVRGSQVCTAEPLPATSNEIQLGEVGGVPFLIDRDLYVGWGCPNLVVDLIPGCADTFSVTAEEIRIP